MKIKKDLTIFFNKVISLIVLLLINFKILSQSDTLPKKIEIFGHIYPYFSSIYANNQKTMNSFDVSTAQVGLIKNINNKIKAIILYNVTQTTRDISVKDSVGNSLTVNYIKGSDYTLFLKQAEVTWKTSNITEFSAGQILNEQYLTVQDKFWGYRYIMYTMQEYFRFGHQADFGFRWAINFKKIRFSSAITNGEGPFYKQDKNGFLQYALNFQYLSDKWIFKIYSSYYPGEKNVQWCINPFLAYKSEKIKIGLEASKVYNYNWQEGNEFTGYSFFLTYKINEEWSALLRQDYIEKNLLYKNLSYSLIGFEYCIDKSLKVSLNQRLLNTNAVNTWQSFINIGFTF